MDSNLTLRRRQVTLQMSSSNQEEKKNRARRTLFSLKQMQALLVAFSLAIVYYISTRPSVELNTMTAPGTATSKHIQQANNKSSDLAAPKDFDCAIFWLRMPKTASTTIAQTFIRPLFRRGNFTNIELGPNSCVTHVGGCAPYWNKQTSPMRGNMRERGNMGMNRNRESMNALRTGGSRRLSSASNIQYVPPFGRKVPMSEQKSANNRRCFPSESNQNIGRTMQCHEYDPVTSTLNYGKRPPINGRKKQPSKVQGNFNAGPRITTHVGIDPSLFGWVLPPKPMVFSTFRDPLERIFSSFHYGIQFGGM